MSETFKPGRGPSARQSNSRSDLVCHGLHGASQRWYKDKYGSTDVVSIIAVVALLGLTYYVFNSKKGEQQQQPVKKETRKKTGEDCLSHKFLEDQADASEGALSEYQ
eukprot:458598-Rhodomonas_salina.1